MKDRVFDDDQHLMLRCYFKRPDLFQLFLNDEKWPVGLSYFQKNSGGNTERARIINTLKDHLPKSRLTYLEIGISGGTTHEQVEIEEKYGVDPDPKYTSPNIFSITSDAFFEHNQKTFDMIFIDGLHHSNQVLKDLQNSMACLSIPGFIVIDDVLPLEESEQTREERPPGSPWTGDVWKSIYFLIQRYPYWKYTLHESSEIGFRSILSIYWDQSPPSPLDCTSFDWKNYEYHRDFSSYVQKLKKVVYVPNHLFLVTSKIFGAESSLYTPEERFQQLKKTVHSIRQQDLNSTIVLLEGSVLETKMEKELYNAGVHVILSYPNDHVKSIGELYLLRQCFSEETVRKLIPFTNFVHKLSGRFQLTSPPEVNYNRAIFRKQFSWKNESRTTTASEPIYYYETVYYNFPVSLLDVFQTKLTHLWNHRKEIFQKNDIEHVFYRNNIFSPDNISEKIRNTVEGNLAPTKGYERA